MSPSPSSSTSDTIYALSSGPPPAAIAVIRISGRDAPATLRTIAGIVPPPRLATLRTLRTTSGEPLDRALVLFFPAPASATGEDVGEVHVHGGKAVIAAVLRTLHCCGLRHAEPGEFTRRAVLNGRMGLGDAEGLADLLAAETEAQRREALLRATGVLTRRLLHWQAALVSLCADVEAAIDHDDEGGSDDPSIFRAELERLSSELERELAKPAADRLHDGFRVAIVGPPNAGKSSLFNSLLGDDAAIVSAVPGTTRDVVERAVSFEGIPFILADTAGLRSTGNAVEREGILRARATEDAADIVLDLSDEAASGDGRIAIVSKADLGRSRYGAISVSSVTNEGLDGLVSELVGMARSKLPPEGEAAMVSRQRAALRQCVVALVGALAADDFAVVAERLRSGREALDRVIGRGGLEDVFDVLFARFCLGK